VKKDQREKWTSKAFGGSSIKGGVKTVLLLIA
jgi:hypothetical protein